MPDEFLDKYDALQIAEIQAYYTIKAQDRQREDNLREQDRQIEEKRTHRRRW